MQPQTVERHVTLPGMGMLTHLLAALVQEVLLRRILLWPHWITQLGAGEQLCSSRAALVHNFRVGNRRLLTRVRTCGDTHRCSLFLGFA